MQTCWLKLYSGGEKWPPLICRVPKVCSVDVYTKILTAHPAKISSNLIVCFVSIQFLRVFCILFLLDFFLVKDSYFLIQVKLLQMYLFNKYLINPKIWLDIERKHMFIIHLLYLKLYNFWLGIAFSWQQPEHVLATLLLLIVNCVST